MEVFITRGSESYLELQLSPLGQPFSYLITKPRVECEIPEELPVEMSANIKGKSLLTSISIPLSFIPGDSNLIQGGCFCCLGEDTEYYALNPNSEESADFHRPDLFITFGEF